LHNRDTVTVCSGDTARFDASVNVNRVGDSIVIVYDATQGQSGLAGATKVYMHSGPEFRPFQGWQTAYTVGHYGIDDGVGQMTSLGANKWRIAIDPSCYYGFNPDTPLNGIFMVFRNANGSQSGKDAGGNDIFVYTAVTPPTCSFNGVTASRRATNAVTYSWSNGGTSAVGSFTTAGTYYVTATEGSCSKVDTVTVTVATPPSVNLGNDVCLNGGTASLNAGTGFSSYLWSTGASTQTITANQAGTYWVRVTNASGCKGSDTIVVAAAPRVSLGRDTCVASGSTVVLNAGAGYSRYNWSTGDSTQTINVTQSGTYIITVTNAGGCTGRDTILVSVGGLTVNAGADTCINTGGSRVLNAGAGFSSYRWSTGATTASITVTTPGVYVVTVTSASGCTGSDTVVITSCTIVNPGCKPDAKFNVVHNAASYAATFINQSTGRAPLHFFWNYGDNTNSTDSGSSVHTYGQAGLYTVTLIVCNDTCGCDTFTAQVSITVGINEIEGLSAVNLYPNPASTNCILSVTTADRTEAVITVNNTLGAIVATEKWELNAGKNDRNLDMSSMAAGMYTITLKTEAGTLTRKLNIIK
jgi:PKD repeat protein